MKNLGIGLVILGVLFILFQMAGCESERPSTLTDWMENWGSDTALAIKAGLIGLGIVLIVVSDRKPKR
jgi:hypothetical protein